MLNMCVLIGLVWYCVNLSKSTHHFQPPHSLHPLLYNLPQVCTFSLFNFIIHLPQYRSVLYNIDISKTFALQTTQHRYLISTFIYLDCSSTSNNAKTIPWLFEIEVLRCVRSPCVMIACIKAMERILQTHASFHTSRSLFLTHSHLSSTLPQQSVTTLPPSVSHSCLYIFLLQYFIYQPPTNFSVR